MFVSTLQKLKGIDLSSYRENFLQRRLNSRIEATNSENLFAYFNIIKKEVDEYNRFLEAISINVTEFSRDPDVFDFFRKNCFREIIQRKVVLNHSVIRFWSAACASGEEAYSLAIIIREELRDKLGNFRIRVWGTDVDKDALEEAKKAEYSQRSLNEVDSTILNRYFINVAKDLYRLKAEVRDLVKFSTHNLMSDAALKYVDVIFCRNLMIYLRRKQQEELLMNLYKALNPGGYLVIGKVESILGSPKELFVPVDLNRKIFQKRR